jgi:8-oxo-dGTP pyrophosphatase MutT (NUDIX family)
VSEIPIIPLTRLELRVDRAPWPFASERRAEIDAHFAALKRAKPKTWNGRSLLLRSGEIVDGVLRGVCFETDYANSIAWRDWGFPDPSVRNIFAMAALRAADGAYVLAVMGAHTVSAGHVYFPAGTPDPSDVDGETLNLERGVMRELAEETGLTAADVTVAPGWYATPFGQRLALMKPMQSPQDAEPLRARIRAFLAAEHDPELADVHIVRSLADLHPRMPPYVTAYLKSRLQSPA